jgi:hypothetical protein
MNLCRQILSPLQAGFWFLREDESTRRKVCGQLHICCAEEKKLAADLGMAASVKEWFRDGLSSGFASAFGRR